MADLREYTLSIALLESAIYNTDIVNIVLLNEYHIDKTGVNRCHVNENCAVL